VGALMWLSALALMYSCVHGHAPVWRPEMLKHEWAFSLPLAIGTLVAVSASYLDRILVSHFFGAEQFGIYTNASVEVPTVSMITNATGVVLLAEFSRRASRGELAGIMPVWHQAMLKAGLWIFASFGFLAFWGVETMRILFSDRFADSGSLFAVMVWSIPSKLLTFSALYISIGLTGMMVGITLSGLVLEIFLLLLFGRLYGLQGMALGVVVSYYLVVVVAIHCYVRRVTQVGWRAFLPWKRLGLAMVASLAAGAVSRIVPLLAHGHLHVLAVYLLAMALYLGVYLLMLQRMRLLRDAIPDGFWPLSRGTGAKAEL